MKILFVDQFSEMGGGQRCFLDLLPAIEREGWGVEAALPGAGPLVLRLNATPITCGPYHSGSKSGLDALRFAFDLREQVRTISRLIGEGGFDLLYVNGPRVLPGAALASRGRVPILFHAHNYLDKSYSARLTGWSVNADTQVVACSDFVAGPLRRYVPPKNLHVIRNGAPDLGFRERSFEPPWRIGIVGSIEPQKGQAEFLQAARRISDARFVICGAPSAAHPRYREQVHTRAAGLPVEFPGWREDRPGMFSDLDLVAIPSKQEGLSLVMLEAFSAGVPVVAYAAGGMTEVIRHGETGFLVPECAPSGLASQIQTLMDGAPARLRTVAAQARSVWERLFDIKLYQARMLEALRQATGAIKRERPPELP